MAKKFNNNAKDFTKNNYFKQNIQKYGPKFLEIKKNEKTGLLNEPPRIFRDLIRNRVDFRTESQYFYDNELLSAMINNAREHYKYYYIIFNALQNQFAIKSASSDEQIVYNKVAQSLDVYYTLLMSLQEFEVTRNIDWIVRIPFIVTNKSLANYII